MMQQWPEPRKQKTLGPFDRASYVNLTSMPKNILDLQNICHREQIDSHLQKKVVYTTLPTTSC